MRYAQYSDDYAVSMISFNEATINVSQIIDSIGKAIDHIISFLSKFFGAKGIISVRVTGVKEKLDKLKKFGNKKCSVKQNIIVVNNPNPEGLKKYINDKLNFIREVVADTSNMGDQQYWENKIREYNNKTSLKNDKLVEYSRKMLGVTATRNEQGEIVYINKEYSFNSTVEAVKFIEDKIAIMEQMKNVVPPFIEEMKNIKGEVSKNNSEEIKAKIAAINSITTNIINSLNVVAKNINDITNILYKQSCEAIDKIASELEEAVAPSEEEQDDAQVEAVPQNAGYQFTYDSKLGHFGSLNLI